MRSCSEWMRWFYTTAVFIVLIPLSGLCDDSIPSFVSSPSTTNIEYSNRNGTSLNCRISEPGAFYEWFEVAAAGATTQTSSLTNRIHGIRNERRVHDVPGFRTVFQNGTLQLSPFRSYEYNPEMHSTTYQCRAKFGALGLISASYTLHPVLQETILLRVKDVYAHRGNSAFLRCEIPEHTESYVKLVEWLDGSGRRVGWNPTDKDKYSLINQGHLIVHQISSFDEYTKFMCVAQNILTGEVYRSNQATIFVTDSEMMYDRTGLVYPISNYTKISLLPGQNYSFGCIGQGIPVPQTIWYKSVEGDQLYPVSNSKHTKVHEQILQLNLVEAANSASYICQVTNSNFQQTARFDVEISPEYKLSLSPSLERTRKGSNVTLTCSSNREVQVNSSSITWYRNAQLLEPSSNRHIIHGNRLKIVGVGEQDGGIYQCFHTHNTQIYSDIARIIIQDSVPEIISSFAGDTYIPGQYLSLKCVARGRPPPRFQWLLDGYAIQTDGRYRQSQYVTAIEDVESQLNLTHLTDKDGGHYSCVAINSAGTIKHTQHVRVFGPPFIREVGDVSGVEGGWLQTVCPVSGYPIQSITWKKEGRPIQDSNRFKVFQNGTIIFNRVEKSLDEGEYTCTATSSVSHFSRNINLKVIVAPKMVGFSFQTLEEGMRTVVACQAVEGELPIQFQWYRNDEILEKTDSISFQQGPYSSTIFFNELDREQSGNYTCKASNDAGSDSRSAHLSVNVPPEWSSKPSDSVIAAVGDFLSVPCDAFGVPPPSRSWHKSEKDGSLTEVERISRSGFDVDDVVTSWSGNYTCTLDNGVGRPISKNVEIIVKSPPRFRTGEREGLTDTRFNFQNTVEKRARRGDEINLECSAQGDPVIKYTWSKNAMKLEQNILKKDLSITGMTANEDGQVSGSILKLNMVEPYHAGLYKCEAENEYGHDVLTYHLVVIDIPSEVYNVSISELTTRQAHVQWSQPNSANSPVLHYTVHTTLLSEGFDRLKENEITVGGQSRSLILRSLIPGQEYFLTVRAHNEVGAGRTSKRVKFTTEELAPEGKARIVRVTGFSSTELEVVWTAPPRAMWNSRELGYTIGYRIQGSGSDYVTINISVTSDKQFTFIIPGLECFSRYEMVIEVWNYKGRGEKTSVYTASTLQDAPSGSVEDLNCEVLSSTSIRFKWNLPLPRERNGEITSYSYQYYRLQDPDQVSSGQAKGNEIVLDKLEMFSNYSFRIKAHTQIGGGPYSVPIQCTTLEDVPGAPERIKVVSTGDSSFYVSWLPPGHPGGNIIRYTIYWRLQEQGAQIQTVKTRDTKVRLGPLGMGDWYDFWVRAETRVGQGPASSIATILAQNSGNAQIVNFGLDWKVEQGKDHVLDCIAVGKPQIGVRWIHNGNPITKDPRYTVLQNRSISIHNASRELSGKYHCEVENRQGADRITHDLVVETEPGIPEIRIQNSGIDSVEVVWSMPRHSTIPPVVQYVLAFRSYSQDWQSVKLLGDSKGHKLTGLECGSQYSAYLRARNRIGTGKSSNIVEFRTLGEGPSLERKEPLVTYNISTILINLQLFKARDCPVTRFRIDYTNEFTGQTNLAADIKTDFPKIFRIENLLAATRYKVRITAVNSAGDIQVEEEVTTLDIHGNPVIRQKVDWTQGRLAVLFVFILAIPCVLTGLGFIAYSSVCKRLSSDQDDRSSLKKAFYRHDSRMTSNQGFIPTLPPAHLSRQPLPPHLPNPEDLYEEISPYATVEVANGVKNNHIEVANNGKKNYIHRDQLEEFNTLYHQGFVHCDNQYKSLRSGAGMNELPSAAMNELASGAGVGTSTARKRSKGGGLINFYTESNQMETFRIKDSQGDQDVMYAHALNSVDTDSPGYETEESESESELTRKLRKKRAKSISSTSRGKNICQEDSDDPQDFRAVNHQEYQVPVHSSYQLINTEFDPFDFPPKRKPKLKNSFQETKFGH